MFCDKYLLTIRADVENWSTHIAQAVLSGSARRIQRGQRLARRVQSGSSTTDLSMAITDILLRQGRTPAVSGVPGVELLAAERPGQAEILSAPALAFVVGLQRRFGARRRELLEARRRRQARFDAGERPDFLADTAAVRKAHWRIAPTPAVLADRRVEITGPVERKLIINALNSGASVFMADFEDSTSPTWANLVDGQINLRDAVAGTIEYTPPQGGRSYRLAPKTATLFVRPRGWHLPEKHVRVDGEPMSGSLFDLGLFLFHNAQALSARGAGPFVYLPKLQSHLEARLWNDVLVAAQEALGLPRGTIKATVLIETLPAAFEMEEILFELREHSAGLNCGRWDYIFSFIKTFRADPACVLPDRATLGMTQHFLRSYSRLLIATCHRRGAHAMGGMAAQIPIKDDAAANRAALDKVEADKQREVGDGHDGTWVAHPGLVDVARRIFDTSMPGPNQVHRLGDGHTVSRADLLAVPSGSLSEAGLRHNVDVGLRYLAAWLSGNGCVPLDNLMEDAATAEISRTQVWQWIRHGAHLVDGRTVTPELYRDVQADVVGRLRERLGETAFDSGRYAPAAALFDQLITAPELPDFLTLPAYDALTD
jgi:malate synthase